VIHFLDNTWKICVEMEPMIAPQEVRPGGFNKQVIITIRRFGIKDITSVFLAALRSTLSPRERRMGIVALVMISFFACLFLV
jgi:hypothetical protein